MTEPARSATVTEDSLRRAFAEGPFAAALVGPDGRLLEVSRRAAELLGYAPEELAGRQVRELIRDEEVPEAALLIDQLTRRGPSELQWRVDAKAADGRWRTLRGSASMVRDDRGLPLHVYVRVEEPAAHRRAIEASERERSHWARELHDQTLQALAALRLSLAAAREDGSAESLGEAVDEACDQLTTEIQALRAIIADLRPLALDELGLRGALEALVASHDRDNGPAIRAELRLGRLERAPDERLDPEVERAAYRIVQESLSNADKHAGASLIRVRAVVSEGNVELEVSDDGTGFDVHRRQPGLGLSGMRERAELAGGSLAIDARPGGGTRVRATLPIDGERRSSQTRDSSRPSRAA